jgi:hypothetical protein
MKQMEQGIIRGHFPIAVSLSTGILISMLVPCAQAAISPTCKAIDDAYVKQILSPVKAKLARTSTGALSKQPAMIYRRSGHDLQPGPR